MLALGVLLVFVAGLTFYEHAALDWHFAREAAPEPTTYQWLRAALSALISFAAVGAIASAARAHPVGHVPPAGLAAGWIAMTGVLLLTGVLVASPQAYFALGSEDGFVEWLSAAALTFSAALMALSAVSNRLKKNRLGLAIALAFALLFFVMGMEEISWGQRLFGFQTPEDIAARNWQGEFNLHNMQTDLTELAMYTATGIFLVIAPIVRERVSYWPLVAPAAAFIPDRSVALVSAPMLAFTYARFDLLPMQAVFFGGLAALLLFARDARLQGRGSEALAFLVVAFTVFAAQIVHLLYGHTMVQVHDPSEFRELFLALGIGWYGRRQWQAARA